MKNHKLLLIIPLLVLTIIPALPSISRVNAATGLVCLTDTSGVCGTTLAAPVGNQLRVSVFIRGSDALNAFDITLLADHTVLQAAGADLTGTILPGSASIVVHCDGGVLISGSSCSPNDTVDTLHVAAVAGPGMITGSPATGLLFTGIYNVLSQSPSLPIGFQTGCRGTSVPDGTCVTIANGTPVPDSEMVQGTNFSNLTDFTITASPTSMDIAPSTTGTSTITLTSFGGYSDFVNLTHSTSSAMLTCSMNSDALGGVSLPADGTATATLSCSSSTPGSYSVTVTGTGSANPSFTHSVNVPVKVEQPNFSLSASPSSLNIAPGNTGTSTITVASLAGFAGSVSLASTVTPSTGLSCGVNPTSVPAGSTSTLSCSGSTGSYTVTVTGTSGSLTHSTTVAVTVGISDFSFSAVPDTISLFRIKPSAHAGVLLNLASLQNFAGSITMTVSWQFAFIDTPGQNSLPDTLTNLGTYNGMLSAGQTALVSFDVYPVAANTGTGLYVATITATGSGKTHTAQVNIWMLDFTVTPKYTTMTIINQPGTWATDPVVLQPIGAPHNATGDIINPYMTFGPAGNAGAGTYPTQYGYGTTKFTSSRGALFASALGLDTSFASRRCFSAVYDTSGNLILPTYTGSTVTSFAAPVVHYNGDQDGDPPNFNGCRFDSIFAMLPDSPDFGQIVVEPITTSPNGSYTASVCFQVGSLIDCNSYTVVLVSPPPGPPAFNQFLWQGHKISLSRTGIVTFKAGLNTTSTDPVLDAYVQVTAVSSDGSVVIVGQSAVVTLQPGTNTNNIVVTLDFTGTPPATTYSISAIAFYGIHNVTLISAQSTATIGTSDKIIGSLTITS